MSRNIAIKHCKVAVTISGVKTPDLKITDYKEVCIFCNRHNLEIHKRNAKLVDSFRKIFIGGTLYSHTPSPNSELTQTKSIIIVIEHRDDQTRSYPGNILIQPKNLYRGHSQCQ